MFSYRTRPANLPLSRSRIRSGNSQNLTIVPVRGIHDTPSRHTHPARRAGTGQLMEFTGRVPETPEKGSASTHAGPGAQVEALLMDIFPAASSAKSFGVTMRSRADLGAHGRGFGWRRSIFDVGVWGQKISMGGIFSKPEITNAFSTAESSPSELPGVYLAGFSVK